VAESAKQIKVIHSDSDDWRETYTSRAEAGVVIHPTAIVSPEAVIGEGTVVGPYSIIGARVVLGERNDIRSHVVIEGITTIGDDNIFFQFASVGAAPQDLKYRGEESRLIIGNKNTIREYVTLQPGTAVARMETTIGDLNLFMACTHVGHDSIIGNDNKIANNTVVAGHCVIGNKAVISGLVGIHQFVTIGDYAMVAGGAMIEKDIPPFCMAQGDRACLAGLNKIGMQRGGISDDDITLVRKAYRKLFMGSGQFSARLEEIADIRSQSKYVEILASFVEKSERGVATVRKGSASSEG
jgi:UDP-N-acetylglucosamine acyltransferase